MRKKKNREEDEDAEEGGGGTGEEEEREDREGGSRNFDENLGEVDNESLMREAEWEEEEEEMAEETELNDQYMNGHRPNHRYNREEVDIDVSSEIDLPTTTESLRVPELLTSPTGTSPSIRLDNGVVVHQYNSSPYPSRQPFTVRRVCSSGANLNTLDENVPLTTDDDGDCFRTGNSERPNSNSPIPNMGQSRRDRPLSLSHIESHSHDLIPAMRACALIRNRIHHSSHSSGLYVTQYSEGFSITAV